jgi:hypothetical protein
LAVFLEGDKKFLSPCLTEEELDFIINYDIKYRMGDELNDNE